MTHFIDKHIPKRFQRKMESLAIVAFRSLTVSIFTFCTVLRTSSAIYPSRELDFQRASPSEDEYVLNLNKLSGNPDNLMEQIKDLASALQPCESDLQYQMSLFHIRNRTVTCNDGSPAGFYLRESSGSKKWLIYLEGGSFCFSNVGCSHRETRLKSSCSWPKKKIGTGILSADPEENPVWWKANVVYVPYCSSDVWSGTVTAEESGSDYAFMGALILDEVIKELMLIGILDAKQLILAGSSAGGTGVLLNIDRVADMMTAAGSSASVRGLADSGWFLQTDSLDAPTEECSDFLFCNPSLSIKLGSRLWRSYAPSACTDIYNQSWKCFFGFRIYPTIRSPVFIFQWLYDEAQLTIGMGGPPREIRHLNYMQKIGRLTRVSLRNVTSVFAPACYSHMILLQSHWAKVQVRNSKLSRSIQCWLKSQDTQDRQNEHRPRSIELQTPPSGATRTIDDIDGLLPLPDSLASASQMREPTSGGPADRQRRNTESAEERRRRRKSKKRKGSNESEGDRGSRRRGNDPDTTGEAVPTRKKPKRCHQKLIEHATCPHCNPTCPKPINTSTGEEMEFVHFLRLAGMDLGALASQLGLNERDLADVDPHVAMEVISAAARRSSG